MESGRTLSTDVMRELLDAYIEMWSTGVLNEMERVIHPEFEFRMTPGFEPSDGRGHDALRAAVSEWRTAYPDMRFWLEETLFSHNAAAVLFRNEGTNLGPHWHEPTGKRIAGVGMSIYHFEDGMLKDDWVVHDTANYLTMLGFNFVAPWEIQ